MKSTLKLFGFGTLMAVCGAMSMTAFAGGESHQEALGKTERGFVVHTTESAPQETVEVLNWCVENFGYVPHVAGIMADSPALSRSYWQLQLNLQSLGTLTPAEDNVVQMAIAMENECQYCVAGHTMAGRVFFGSSEDQLTAIRSKGELSESKLNVLRDFAVAVYESHGRVTNAQLESFYAAGYTRAQALDVVANVSAKIMSNYTNQIAMTPIDEPLKPLAEGLPFQEDRAPIQN
ncbi:MAG: hypothetical protein AAGB34_02390 [Planctomycetota bacterium]